MRVDQFMKSMLKKLDDILVELKKLSKGKK